MDNKEETPYYKLVRKETMSGLELEVNELIEKGFEPAGGMVHINSHGLVYYMQAMYREKGKQVILG